MLVGPALVVLAVAGCGDREISAEKSEEFVRETARAPQLIEDVSCPEGLSAEVGRTFECRIAIEDGSEEVVTLRQTDDDVHIEVVEIRQTKPPRDPDDFAILPENVEAFIRRAAPERERIVSVDCPPDVDVEKGNSFECIGRLDDGRELVYEIEQKDELGNVVLAGSRKRKR